MATTGDIVAFRAATSADAVAVADLHADSWRRHYRGAYPESFFGDTLDDDRRAVWSARLDVPGDSATIVAECSGSMVGFVHVILSGDPEWGALVDNLHVRHDFQRRAVASRLMGRAASFVEASRPGSGVYLWVLDQNVGAQAFYRSIGGRAADRRALDPPALAGVDGIRFVWPDPAASLIPLDGP